MGHDHWQQSLFINEDGLFKDKWAVQQLSFAPGMLIFIVLTLLFLTLIPLLPWKP